MIATLNDGLQPWALLIARVIRKDYTDIYVERLSSALTQHTMDCRSTWVAVAHEYWSVLEQSERWESMGD